MTRGLLQAGHRDELTMNLNKDKSSEVTKGELKLDVRGLICPEPIVRTKQALESIASGTITVFTDSSATRDNILRFAERVNCQVSWQEREPGVYAIWITKTKCLNSTKTETGTVVFISSDQIGQGEPELGRLLLSLFLRTLTESSYRPSLLVLMNNGVKLALADSQVLSTLQTIEHQGIEVRICGTCLDFYGVKDRVRVGTVSNMYELVEILWSGNKVITI